MKNTYTTPADFWQERDFGAKISAAFEFLRVHWRPLGRVLLYLVVPLSLVQGIVTGALQLQIINTLRQNSATNVGFSVRYSNYLTAFQSPAYFASSVLGLVFQAVLILSVYGYLMCCVYAERPGTPVTVPAVWAVVKSKVLSMVFSLVGLGLLVGFGFVFFFIPGLYMLVTLSLFFAVSTFENSGFIASVSRCIDLIKGKWWSTFGLLAIMVLILYMAAASTGVVLMLAGGAKELLTTNSALPSSLSVVLSAVEGLLSLLFYVPVMLVLAFQYFNLVERREGLGLRLLVQELGNAQAAPEAQSSHYRPDDEGEY